MKEERWIPFDEWKKQQLDKIFKDYKPPALPPVITPEVNPVEKPEDQADLFTES